MEQKHIDICERLEWTVTQSDGSVELGQYSPAGEDFSICVEAENFVENVKEYAAGFDTDEHIELWIEARRNGVGGIPPTRELVTDAEAIDEMLRELSAALLEEVD